MKKIIILLLTFLLSACSAVKPAETLSSMQTEPAAETTVTETAAPEKTTEPPVEERSEQKPVPEATTAMTPETPVETVKADAPAESPRAPEMPAETVKVEIPTEIPEIIKTSPESVSEPPKAEIDINYWVGFARSYALQIGLEIDPTAVDCWDNPTTANADCIYLERDLTHRLDRYNRDEDITAVNIWAENLGNGNYLIYIAYA